MQIRDLMPIENNIDEIIAVFQASIDSNCYRSPEYSQIIIWILNGKDTESKLWNKIRSEWGIGIAKEIWGERY